MSASLSHSLSLLTRQLVRLCPSSSSVAAAAGTRPFWRPLSLHAPSPSPRDPSPVTLIQGDGVYPEILDSVETVLQASGAPVSFESFFLSDVHEASSAGLADVVESVRRNGVCLRGTMGIPESSRSGALDSVDMRFRTSLDLFANVVLVKSQPGIRTRHQNVDMVIIKEQLEGLCKGGRRKKSCIFKNIFKLSSFLSNFSCLPLSDSALEHESVPGVVECLKIVTERRTRRIAKFAFDYATQNGRSRVTAVHKANIMKMGDGLFLQGCEEIAHLYPNIKFETMIVDNCSMQLVSNPHQFDVLVTPNLYGDILINLGAGLVGGAGVTPGRSYSADVVSFEPACKHMFSAGAGRNCANPTAMLYAASDLLAHLGHAHHSRQLREAVERVVRSGKVKTKDLGGHGTTKQFVNAVIQNLR